MKYRIVYEWHSDSNDLQHGKRFIVVYKYRKLVRNGFWLKGDKLSNKHDGDRFIPATRVLFVVKEQP